MSDVIHKMVPEIKAQWVAALRSGKFRQAREMLRDSGGAFCCLGVLSKLYADEQGEAFSMRKHSELGDDPFIGDKGLPCSVVALWSGLDWGEVVTINGRRATLYDHNDKGRTFAEIADAIEAQL